MTNATTKGFFVNVYHADGSAHSSTYFKTEQQAQARAERMRKTFAAKHPDRVVEVSKTRAR